MVDVYHVTLLHVAKHSGNLLLPASKNAPFEATDDLHPSIPKRNGTPYPTWERAKGSDGWVDRGKVPAPIFSWSEEQPGQLAVLDRSMCVQL